MATAPRPDIRARLAQKAAAVNASKGSDIYRFDNLVKEVTDWKKAAIFCVEDAVWYSDVGRLAAFSIWGPNERGLVPCGLRYWSSSFLSSWTVPRFVAVFFGGKQLWGRSVRLQQNGGA